MQESSKYLFGGIAVLLFCGLGIYIFGPPTTAGQPVKFGALVLIGAGLIVYGLTLKFQK